MEGEEKDINKNNNEEERDKLKIKDILKYIFEPGDDHLSELTDIPLNQVNPMAWMITFETAVEQMAKEMEYEEAKKKGEDVQQPKRILLSNVWRKAFYQHRRSLEGSGIMRASTLAMKQIETQQETGTDVEDQILRA